LEEFITFCLFFAPENNQTSIGNHAQITARVYLFGAGGIHVDDFVCASSEVRVYSMIDDFSVKGQNY